MGRPPNPYRSLNEHEVESLPENMHSARRIGALREILLDPQWLRTKLEGTDVVRLIADFDFLPGDGSLRVLQAALTVSAHALTHEPGHLDGQLYGRLMSVRLKGVRAFVRRLLRETRGPWLRPLTQTLEPPDSSLSQILRGHRHEVKAVAVTPDGRRAVSGSGDRTVKVWDLERGVDFRTFVGHGAWIRAVAVTPDGRFAASGAANDTVKLWNLESGREIGGIKGEADRIVSLGLTPDAHRVIFAPQDRTIRIWEPFAGNRVRTLGTHESDVMSLAVSPDGRLVVSASGGFGMGIGRLQLWDLDRRVERWSRYLSGISAVAFSGDGKRIVYSSYDRTLQVCKAASGAVVTTIATGNYSATSIAVSLDGGLVATDFHDNAIRVWDLRDGSVVATLLGHGYAVWALAMTPDGRRVVSGAGDASVRVWDLNKQRRGQPRHGHDAGVNAVAVTANGRFAVSAGNDGAVKVWNLRDFSEFRVFTGHRQWVKALVMMPDGRRVVSGCSGLANDGPPKVWDLRSGVELGTLGDSGDPISAVALGIDGRHLFVASNPTPTEGKITVWDVDNFAPVRVLDVREREFVALAVVPGDGSLLYVTGGGALKAWSRDGRPRIRTLGDEGEAIASVGVTPNGRYAIAGSGKLASGEGAGVSVWDARKGVKLRAFAIHRHNVVDVALLPDGRRALSASMDGTLKVWEIASGRVLASFAGDNELRCCAVAPDGRTIVAGESSGRVHFLRLDGAD